MNDGQVLHYDPDDLPHICGVGNGDRALGRPSCQDKSALKNSLGGDSFLTCNGEVVIQMAPPWPVLF